MNSFDLAMESLIEKAQETANIVEGDYIGEDNLYYCGKCRTRKQTVIHVFGGTRVVPCICECKAAEIKATIEVASIAATPTLRAFLFLFKAFRKLR